MIELTDKLFNYFKEAMVSVVADAEDNANQTLFLEFDGMQLKLYTEDGYHYYEESITDYDYTEELLAVEPFKKAISFNCIKNCLEEINKWSVDVLAVRIFTEKGKVFLQVVNTIMPDVYDLNIVCECYLK
jgi:hypothetical protein